MSQQEEIEVVGIRFKKVGKIYYYSTNGLKLEEGMDVIAESVRGLEYAKIEIANRMIPKKEAHDDMKPVIRIATKQDYVKHMQNKEDEKVAFEQCLKKIEQHKLDMKLIDVEYTFDKMKLLFYFTAEGRIDFRMLVKDLASVFKTRIELRQIGVRDEAKILNGIGMCGRSLCCATFLGDFQPVSIKMAKDQSLSLNPTKISGICGRLMCCLKYEEETYEHLNSKMPKVGDIVNTPEGKGEVLSTMTIRQKVKVAVDNQEIKEALEFSVDDIEVVVKKKTRNNHIEMDDELRKILD